MNTLHRLLALTVFALTVASVNAGTYANITLDGSTSDWSGISAAATNTGDSPINQIFLANNDSYLFIRITFTTPVNFLTDGFRLNIDNDNNTSTGFNTYTLGLIGSEVLYEGETAYQQSAGNYNTGATTNAPILASPYGVATTDQEFGIALTSIIDTAQSTLVFPNSTFSLASYFEGSFNGSTTFTKTGAYTLASAIPEPSACAALAGLGVLALVFARRRRQS